MLPPRRLRRQPRDRCLGLALAVVLLAAIVALCTYSSAPLAQRLQDAGVALVALTDHTGGRVLLEDGINLAALDGTAGRQGPRRWNDTEEQRAQARSFEDTTAQLSRQEQETYRKWVAWSEKPPGQDYVQPSVTHFSLGKMKPFKGDANQPGVLKAMLEARSYKKELIVFLMAGTGVADMGLNFVFNLRDLGYDHWAVFADDEADCDRLEAAVGNAGCIWTTVFDAEDAPDIVRGDASRRNSVLMWVKRWLHVARIIRLGYNIFNIDSDMVIHDDMYKYLKGPLIGNLTWYCGDEDYGIGCNGGTNYIQNAAPDGAAAWMAGTMSDWMLRVLENYELWEKDERTKGPWSRNVMDQNLLPSLVRSATLGFVVMPTMYPDVDADAIRKAHDELPWEGYDEHNMLEMPLEWRERFASDEIGARWHKIGVPQRRGTPVLDAPRKSFSQRYWDLLSSESGAPMWPEEAQLEAQQRPLPGKQEYLGKTLDFTVQTWKTGFMCGRWWGQKPVRGVVGHTVLIPGAFARVLLFKIAGWYHWKVEQLAVEYYSRKGFYPVWPAGQEAPPKVLLYAPALEFRGVTADEWRAINIALVTAATVLGRVLVWPLLPCGTEWLVNSEAADPTDASFLRRSRWCHVPKNCHCGVDDHWYGTPWDGGIFALPIVDENYPLSRKACLHWRGYDNNCNTQLMYPDFKHMLRQLPAAAAAATTQDTLFADGLATPQRPTFRRVTPEELRSQVESLQGDQTVVYLGAVPHLPAEASSAAPPELQAAHRLCSRSWLQMHGPEWDTFVTERLPTIGEAVSET